MIMVLVLAAFTMSAAIVSAQSTGEMAPAPAPLCTPEPPSLSRFPVLLLDSLLFYLFLRS
ncbi:hypothetical protein Patl1_20586 [Pistacia atlantica]|uniref:Uncharacterized protein n=1 Tax=Pistacia atlantica TaxID=434234 RepID=A0ACC1BKB7_9ROSI|nr:hypothetical protein Patl1_20586 [Pistacia atlantica]